MDDKSFKNLKTKFRGRRFISNTINYEMLSNQRYADALFYTPHDKRTELENEFSDYVA